MIPQPSHSSHSWCMATPMPPRIMPPPQHSAAMKPALRGPARSSQLPQSAADTPRKKMNSVKVRLTDGTVQLQVVVNSSLIRLCDAHAAASVPASSLVIGSQNTEKP